MYTGYSQENGNQHFLTVLLMIVPDKFFIRNGSTFHLYAMFY